MKEFVVSAVKFLSGKKTYIVAIAAIVYAFGVQQGWWHSDEFIWTLLGGSGAMSVRAAISKLCKKVEADTEDHRNEDIKETP